MDITDLNTVFARLLIYKEDAVIGVSQMSDETH